MSDDEGSDPENVELDADEDIDIDDDDEDLNDDEMVPSNTDDGSGGAGHQRSLSSSHAKRRKSTLMEQSEMIASALRQLSRQNSDENDPGDLIMNPDEEMEELQRRKEKITEKWDVIDPNDNGDVDKAEWIQGLQRLEVDLDEETMGRLFELMDGDSSGYLDRQEWTSFLMSNFSNEILQEWQSAILRKVRGHRKHNSNLFNPEEDSDWEEDDLGDLGREMEQELRRQAHELKNSIVAEQSFFEEIEELVQQNPEFANQKKATQWSPQEVAWWLDTIDLAQYSQLFVEHSIDGAILLNDVHTQLLQTEIGVNPLHIGKILRAVDELRHMNREHLLNTYKDWAVLQEENEALQDSLDEAQKKILELQNENSDLKAEILQNTVGEEETKMTEGKEVEIALLRSEVERLQQEKIQLAIATGEEIQNLRFAVRVLQRDHTSLTATFNPLDTLVGALGYKKA